MDPAQTLEMMQNPMVQQMMQQMFSDPQMMENVANSNPMLRQLMDANPHTRAMLQNPQFMRQFADPNNLAAVMQMAQLQRGALAPPGAPSGANPWAGLGAPGSGAPFPFGAGLFPPPPPPPVALPPAPAPPLDPIVQNLDFSNLLSQFGSTNISPPPVPRAPVAPQATAPNVAAPTAGSPTVATPAAAASAAAAPAAPVAPAAPAPAATPSPPSPPAEESIPDEQYASQLRQLNDMGFGDNAANLRALTQTMGNVD